MRLSLLIEYERSAEDNKLTVVDTVHDVYTLQEEPKFTVKIRGSGEQRRETESSQTVSGDIATELFNCQQKQTRVACVRSQTKK
jgi:cell division protein ZapA (FtsZ GTPase activity inhibitor)